MEPPGPSDDTHPGKGSGSSTKRLRMELVDKMPDNPKRIVFESTHQRFEIPIRHAEGLPSSHGTRSASAPRNSGSQRIVDKVPCNLKKVFFESTQERKQWNIVTLDRHGLQERISSGGIHFLNGKEYPLSDLIDTIKYAFGRITTNCLQEGFSRRTCVILLQRTEALTGTGRIITPDDLSWYIGHLMLAAEKIGRMVLHTQLADLASCNAIPSFLPRTCLLRKEGLELVDLVLKLARLLTGVLHVTCWSAAVGWLMMSIVIQGK